MATYVSTARTNYFKVTDEKKYQGIYRKLFSEDNIHDFTEFDKEGNRLHGFGAYGPISYNRSEENPDDDDDIWGFAEDLQKILPDGEAFIYMESGWENLRYITGYTLVATKDQIKASEMNTWAIDTARELLGDQNFKTKLNY